jgi:hypothetical protein
MNKYQIQMLESVMKQITRAAVDLEYLIDDIELECNQVVNEEVKSALDDYQSDLMTKSVELHQMVLDLKKNFIG